MEIEIYQINMPRDKNRVCFLPLNNLERFQGDKKIHSDIYDKVFSGTVECYENLEDIYIMFNDRNKMPEDFKGRFLSISDVINVISSKQIDCGYYYCDSIGFRKIIMSDE